MSIKQDLEELHGINSEITRILESLRKLRTTKKTLETRISDYLRREEIPAVKDRAKGVIVILDKKSRKVFEKPKKEREQEVIDMLQSAGIKNPQELYERMKGVGKASVDRDVLKFNKLN